MSTEESVLNEGDDLISIFLQILPEVFCGRELDKLTGKVLQWRTIQNRRSKGEIPEKCFRKISPKKVVILRNQFLEWLQADMARVQAA